MQPPPPQADLPTLLDQFHEIYKIQGIHSPKKITAYAAYIAAPKDTLEPLATDTIRCRSDGIDATGRVTLRYDGQLFQIGIRRPPVESQYLVNIIGPTMRLDPPPTPGLSSYREPRSVCARVGIREGREGGADAAARRLCRCDHRLIGLMLRNHDGPTAEPTSLQQPRSRRSRRSSAEGLR